MTQQVISAEAFRNAAHRSIEIPGFSSGEKILVKIRNTGIMTMLTNGKIPNQLLGTVNQLFGGTYKATGGAELDYVEVAKLMEAIVNSALVEPKYADIKDYITDAQLEAIFDAVMGEVKKADNFHSPARDIEYPSYSGNVQPTAQPIGGAGN